MIRAVLDTNILISGIFWSGNERRLIDMAVAGKFAALTSIEILKELEEVLLENFTEIPYQRIKQIIRDVLSYALVVSVEEKTKVEIRDIDDVKIVSCALSGNAHYIVTGDKDLKVLEKYQNIMIISTGEFLRLLSKEEL